MKEWTLAKPVAHQKRNLVSLRESSRKRLGLATIFYPPCEKCGLKAETRATQRVRPERAVVKGLTRTGSPQQIEATGLLARCFQHEMDHLDGKLFVDRLRGLKRDLIVRKIRKLAKAGKW